MREIRNWRWLLLVLVHGLAGARATCSLTGCCCDHPRLSHLPQELGAVLHHGLRLRGGAREDETQALTESERGRRTVRVVNKVRAAKPRHAGEKLVEAASAVVPGLADLMPSTMTELQRKKKRNQLSAEEADVANILAHMDKKEVGRPRTLKGKSDTDGSTVEHELAAVEQELRDLRHSQQETPDDMDGMAQQGKMMAKLEKKRELLVGLQRDLQLKSRYGAVKEEVRDEKGQLVYSVANHSMWLDALEDDRLDDVDRWHLGLYDGPTSRYTSAWDKRNMGETLLLESKRRVLRGPHPPKDALMGSARTILPLPPSGVHYFEVVMRGGNGGGEEGGSLGGGNYVGLVDGNVTNWDGCWELNISPPKTRSQADEEWVSSSSLPEAADAPEEEGDLVLPWTISKSPRGEDGTGGVAAARKRRREQRSRRLHIMALHDACARRQGEVGH